MITLQGWKKCPRCLECFELKDFKLRRVDAGIRPQSYCKSCRREYLKEYYNRYRREHNRRRYHNQIRYRQRNRERVCEYLESHPCVDCGESDIRVLEFDHIGTKSENISRLIAIGAAWSTLVVEIAECVIRCANCHRRRTARQFSWWRGTERDGM